MKITGLSLRHLYGAMTTMGPFWEERLVMPLDIYEDFRKRPRELFVNQSNDTNYQISAIFVQLETDEDVIGLAGPINENVAYIIAKQLRPLLKGRDPLAHELLWDIMHRALVHGRQGEAMMAISAVDCALWDFKGRLWQQPVYRLLGGPTRQAVPAYASMLGFDVLDMALVAERAKAYQEQGYKAQKWFFRHGPMSGPEGLRLNEALVRTLRETLGPDDDIMLDCWQSMDLNYVSKLAERIEDYQPRWIEEPAMPDRIDTYRQIRQRIKIPLSGAEHEYTRWGFKRFIEQEALDIIQPDIYWAGGLSETLKIAAYASAHDLITIPHGHSTPAGIHFSVTQSPILTPYQEYLVKWNEIHQHFLARPLKPVNGMIHVPDAPGMNMDLDPDRIGREEIFMPE